MGKLGSDIGGGDKLESLILRIDDDIDDANKSNDDIDSNVTILDKKEWVENSNSSALALHMMLHVLFE
jgi:hypothetical protein